MGKKNKKTVYKKCDSAVLHAMDVKKMSLSPISKTSEGSTSKAFKSQNVSKIPTEPNPHVIDSNISSGSGKCDETYASECFEPSGDSTNLSHCDDTCSPEQYYSKSNIQKDFRQFNVNEDSWDSNDEPTIDDKSKSVDKSQRLAHDQSFPQNSIQENNDSLDWNDEPTIDDKSKSVDKSRRLVHDQSFPQNSIQENDDSWDWNDEPTINDKSKSVDKSRRLAYEQSFPRNSIQENDDNRDGIDDTKIDKENSEHDDSWDWEDEPKMDKKSKVVDKSQMSVPEQPFRHNSKQKDNDSWDWNDERKIEKESKSADKSQITAHDQPFRQNSKQKHHGRFQKEANILNNNDRSRSSWENNDKSSSYKRNASRPFQNKNYRAPHKSYIDQKQQIYNKVEESTSEKGSAQSNLLEYENEKKCFEDQIVTTDKSWSFEVENTLQKQNQSSIRDPEDSTVGRTEKNIGKRYSRDFKERKPGTGDMNNTSCEHDQYIDSNNSSSWSQDNDSSNWHTPRQKSDSRMERRSLESSDTCGEKDKNLPWRKQNFNPQMERRSLGSSDTNFGKNHDKNWRTKQILDPRMERRSLESSGKRFENKVEDSWHSSKQKSDSRMERRSLELFDTSYEKKDEEYKEFVMEVKSMKRVPCTKIIEEERDLFDMSTEYSLAHCVAEDMRMGSGIAVQFKREFKEVDELLSQRAKQGGLAFLETKGDNASRYIYYLVTKRLSTGKPTYHTFWSSLKKMRDHIKDHGVEKLAIPRLGCGLDKLDWSTVKHMIEFLFRDVNVEIIVCSLLQAEDDMPKRDLYALKVVTAETPIWDIESYTIIVYFSTEDGHVTNSAIELDKKFNFLNKFRQTRRNLGDAIRHYDKNRNYILYGCIVRKSEVDSFDFKSLKKCLLEINKNNKQDLYEYVAFEALGDDEGLLHEKILTLMRFYLKKVDIYVCLPKQS